MAKDEKIPKTNPTEIEALIERVRQSNIETRDAELIERLLRTVLTLVNLLQRKNISIRKLKDLVFGGRTEKRQETSAGGEEKPESGEELQGSAERDRPTITERNSSENSEQVIKKGHGRRASSEYSGARVMKCQEENLKAGDQCPHPLCGGRLYDLKAPRILLQFTGQPLVGATKYEQEVLRCPSCQARFVAPLPEEVKPERFDATADATIALMKYGAGFPFYRQSSLQRMCGVPLSESTMYERCESLADAGMGVFKLLRRMAAGGEVIHVDDTRVKILSCLKEDREAKEEDRRATNTSGMVVKVGDRKIAIYASGRRHGGENLEELLKTRSVELPRPIQMSDALASNWVGEQETIGAKCLAHARRKFFELAEIYPAECKVALAAVGEVYKNEAQTAGMSGAQRLAYHQEQSGPVFGRLKEWIEAQFRERLGEPNSSLGKALQYWRNHWEELTTFLREIDAPLDNNLAEQALKRTVLSRKNSLFYKTENGAFAGDVLSSLIETSRLNGVNVWKYLVAIGRNGRLKEAKAPPEQFLPWNYGEADTDLRAA